MPRLLDLPHYSVLSSAAVRCGIDINEVLEELDITTSAEAAPLSQFSLSDIAHLLETLEHRTRQGHLPFALADVFRFDGQPMVSAFITSSRSLRDAGNLFDWVPQLIHPAIRFKRADDGQQTTTDILLVNEAGDEQSFPLLTEVVTAVVRNFSHNIAPGLSAEEAVYFAHSPRTTPQAYEQYFQCPVYFNAGKNQLLAESKVLDQVLPGNLPSAHAQAEDSIRVQLVGDGVTAPLPLLIQDLLRQRLALLSAGIDEVAKALKMHPRALQRQLQKEGENYSAILARTRHELAREILRKTDLDIESIGYKLGFNERRSFTSAFLQWQGQTPSAYRKNTR